MIFKDGIEFIISSYYKLIIPVLDINKCNIELFNSNTINEWILFVNTFNDVFEETVKKLKAKKYKTIEKNNFLIKIPYNYTGSIWNNSPDLYNCTGDKVLLYLEKTKYKLSDIYIRTSPIQYIINCKITPETFANLSISNYTKLTKLMIENGEINETIWCSIACWWNYSTEPVEQSILQYESKSTIPTWINTNHIEKKSINNNLMLKNDDMWLNIIVTYCCPKIFTRCNWFLMLHARAIINDSAEVLVWINENKDSIIWDEDLLSDTPNFVFNECYKLYDNKIILNELGKRFI